MNDQTVNIFGLNSIPSEFCKNNLITPSKLLFSYSIYISLPSGNLLDMIPRLIFLMKFFVNRLTFALKTSDRNSRGFFFFLT